MGKKTIFPTKKLNERNYIPVLGIGTGGLKGKQLRNSLVWAFEYGYRHIDTADYYLNHKEIADFIKSSGIKRDEIFITTKVWKNDLAPEELKGSFNRFLDELQTGYIDLLLIHAPNDDVPISKTLEAMHELESRGEVNCIGVSNFNQQQMEIALDVQSHWKTDFRIKNNQVEFNPRNQKQGLLTYCMENDVVMTAYSPLNKGKDLDLEIIMRLADEYDKSPAQIILRWLLQKGMVVVPRSTKVEHIKENTEIFDWELSDESMSLIDEPVKIVVGENK